MLQRYEKVLELCKEKAKKSRRGVLRDNKGCSYRNCHPSFVILQRELLEAAVCQGFDVAARLTLLSKLAFLVSASVVTNDR